MDDNMKAKLEEARIYKENKKPINIEINKLFNGIFPYDKLYSIFKLGQANLITTLKNDCWNCFDEYGKELIDKIIEADSEDEEMKYFYKKLLKQNAEHEI